MNDINIRPVAPGDIVSYKIGNEVLFCIFVVPEDRSQSYYENLEKAFLKMKSELTGYRYFGIQRGSVNDLSRHLLLLQTVFNNLNAEIWLCNDTESNKANELRLYNSCINSIDKSRRDYYSKPNEKRGSRVEKKRHSSSSIAKTNGSIENHFHDNRRYPRKSVEHSSTSIDRYKRGM